MSAPSTTRTGEHEDAVLAARLRVALARLYRLSRSTEGAAELSASQLSVLTAVETCPGLRIGDLAADQALSFPSATRLVKALVERGLLHRHPDPNDKRVCSVTLAEPGRDLLSTIRSQTTGVLATRVVALSADDRRALNAALPALERLADADA